jgi:hypothetical protein
MGDSAAPAEGASNDATSVVCKKTWQAAGYEAAPKEESEDEKHEGRLK